MHEGGSSGGDSGGSSGGGHHGGSDSGGHHGGSFGGGHHGGHHDGSFGGGHHGGHHGGHQPGNDQYAYNPTAYQPNMNDSWAQPTSGGRSFPWRVFAASFITLMAVIIIMAIIDVVAH
jgi:hypothetical protein